MKVVIMAGGKGTRIASVNSEVPKPMIRINDKPILQYIIENLKEQGLIDYYLIVGYLGSVIKDYFGDGAKYGVNIQYIVEKEPLGTAGALYYLKDQIKDDFLLVNGDVIFDINVNRFYMHHKANNCIATIFTHPNSHPYDSGLIFASDDGKVYKWLSKEEERTWYKNRVNAGIHMLSPRVFEFFTELKKTDLDRDILKPLIPIRELCVYDSPEYVKDMGTPDRFALVSKELIACMPKKKNLETKQKAIFLDRDGTINKFVGFLRNIDDFELIDGVAESIKRVNESGYLTIVISNQPVIARGEVTESELEMIHNKMETLLGDYGSYVDDIFYCPHHPDKGFEGEIESLKIDCNCRKPKPGLLFKAAEKYNIDLANSWMIGDRDNDILAGKNAGCNVLGIGDKISIEDVTVCASLPECIELILGEIDDE